MTVVQSRQPAGTPVGGRFAPAARPEPLSSLQPADAPGGTPRADDAGWDDDEFDPIPGMVACPTCAGGGEVQHRHYGSRSCPEPTIECGTCRGSGEVYPPDTEDDEPAYPPAWGGDPVTASAVCYADRGDDEPF